MRLHPLEKIAKEYFGVTDNLEETGYVLSDGTFLDLSGRHQAAGYERRGDRFVPKKRQPDYLYGQRSIDHRQLSSEIFDAVGTREGSEAMFAFLRATGALRLMPGAGFLVARMPTIESVARVVREWHHAFGDEPLYVDVVSPGSRPDRASRVINPDDVRESQEFERPTIEEVMEFLEGKFGGASMGGKKSKRKPLSPPGRVPTAVWAMIEFAEKHGLDLSVKRDNVWPADIQVEEEVDLDRVKEIVEAIREADGSWPYDLPYPVVTSGATMGLLDGSHRTAAAIYEGLSEIPVLVVDAETFYEIQSEFDVSRFEYVHEILPHIDALAAENNRKDVGAERDRTRTTSVYDIEPGSLGATVRGKPRATSVSLRDELENLIRQVPDSEIEQEIRSDDYWDDLISQLHGEGSRVTKTQLIREWVGDRWDEFLSDLGDSAERGGRLIVYRCISSKRPHDLALRLLEGKPYQKYPGVGIYWTWDFKKAECHWGGGSGRDVIVEALVDLEAIDIEGTVLANFAPNTGPDEREIRLLAGAPVDVTRVGVGNRSFGVDWLEAPQPIPLRA